MEFEWDEAKNLANQKKHKISFEEASKIFDGPILTKEDDRFSYEEERSISMGMIAGTAVVVVAHTDRENRIRIISARHATKAEGKIYNEKLKEIAIEEIFGSKKKPKN